MNRELGEVANYSIKPVCQWIYPRLIWPVSTFFIAISKEGDDWKIVFQSSPYPTEALSLRHSVFFGNYFHRIQNAIGDTTPTKRILYMDLSCFYQDIAANPSETGAPPRLFD